MAVQTTIPNWFQHPATKYPGEIACPLCGRSETEGKYLEECHCWDPLTHSLSGKTCDICSKPATIAIRETRKWANIDEGHFEHYAIPGSVMHFCEEHDPQEKTP